MKYTIPEKQYLSPKVEIRKSSISTKGLFAKELIKKNEVVVIWGGENYTDYQGMLEAKKEGKLIMHWDDDLYSFEDRQSDDTYFINHSCNSNLWLKDPFHLIAKRDINTGEEITIDYSLFEGDKDYIAQWKCLCKEIDCRKRITGNDWKIKDVQERYKDHFLPYINKKIANLNK